MIRKIQIAFLCSTLLVSISASAQTIDPMYESIFIYQISKNIKWDAVKGENFVIEVLGNTPLIRELNRMANKKRIKDKQITVKIITDLKDSKQPDMLFISEKMSKYYHRNRGQIKTDNTLIVTEKRGMVYDSCINFISVGGKIKFEINTTNMDKNHLKCSQSLKSLADRII